MEKDFVSLGYKICTVCEKQIDDCILMDRRLRKTLERKSFVGFALCKDHKKEGFITLIGVDSEKSNYDGERMRPENAYKTGRVVFLKKEVFAQIFNVQIDTFDFVYVEDKVIDFLQDKIAYKN